MALNGTEFFDNPWNVTFSPWTDLFANVTGVGSIFYLFILIIVSFGVQIKTQNPVMTTMFMMGSGALIGSGYLFIGAFELALVFYIFTAFGIAGLFLNMFFQR